MEVNGNSGYGAATFGFGHQISSVSSIEFIVSAGCGHLLGCRHLCDFLSFYSCQFEFSVRSDSSLHIHFLLSSNVASHLTATMGLSMSLRDGSLNLSNTWVRQLSETASGNVCAFLVPVDSFYFIFLGSCLYFVTSEGTYCS